MNNHNAFLKEFLAMRKELTPHKPASKSPEDVLPKLKGNKEKPKAKLSKEQEVDKPGLMTIIQEKPHKKVVIAYLQTKANELTEKKMA